MGQFWAGLDPDTDQVLYNTIGSSPRHPASQRSYFRHHRLAQALTLRVDTLAATAVNESQPHQENARNNITEAQSGDAPAPHRPAPTTLLLDALLNGTHRHGGLHASRSNTNASTKARNQ